jgi:glutathione synthase/RimK-type ligase-like ATP-grasp enzyme
MFRGASAALLRWMDRATHYLLRVRPRIALATYDRAPSLARDDQLLIPALSRAGIDAEPAIWSSADVIWETFDAVIIRSCWDYHLRYDEFRDWLARLDAGRLPLWNSAALVEWNAHKRYLLDLEQRGVRIVPTRLIQRGGAEAVDAVTRDADWTRFVLKPAVSASGFETHALARPIDGDARRTIASVASTGDVLLQPFVDEVPRDGEYSLMFIDGEFSHAAIKRAAGSEFRVQTEHGGSVTAIHVEPWLIGAAGNVLAALPEVPLYARVDGVVRDGQFLLMELELIEPNLFFELKPGSEHRFATAVCARLNRM